MPIQVAGAMATPVGSILVLVPGSQAWRGSTK